MKRCANVIAEEKFRAVDVGKFQENSYFVYVAAFGAFTEVSWNTPQKTKNALGHNAYICLLYTSKNLQKNQYRKQSQYRKSLQKN